MRAVASAAQAGLPSSVKVALASVEQSARLLAAAGPREDAAEVALRDRDRQRVARGPPHAERVAQPLLGLVEQAALGEYVRLVDVDAGDARHVAGPLAQLGGAAEELDGLVPAVGLEGLEAQVVEQDAVADELARALVDLERALLVARLRPSGLGRGEAEDVAGVRDLGVQAGLLGVPERPLGPPDALVEAGTGSRGCRRRRSRARRGSRAHRARRRRASS